MSPIAKGIVASLIVSGLTVFGYGLSRYMSGPTGAGMTIRGDRVETTPEATPSRTKPTPPPGKFATKGALMNRPFVIDDVEYVIESAEDLGDDLSDYQGEHAWGRSNGGRFVLVKFSAKNAGKVSTTLKDIAIFIADSQRRQYERVGASSGIIFSMEGYEEFQNGDFGATQVKPGFTKKLYALSEVAADSNSLSVIVANQKDQNYQVHFSL